MERPNPWIVVALRVAGRKLYRRIIRTVARALFNQLDAASFPMTRNSLKLVRSASTQLSAGVLFRWNQPEWWIDGSLAGPVVLERAHQEALEEFRVRFGNVRDRWSGLPEKAHLLTGATIAFPNVSRPRLRRLWEDDFQHDFDHLDAGSYVRISQEGETQILDAGNALRPSEEMLRKHQLSLLREKRDGGLILPEQELLVSPGGWVLHGQRLARCFGLTRPDIQELQTTCGSIVRHLVHSKTCSLTEGDVSADLRARAARMCAAVRTMRTAEADEALVVVLGLQHQGRNAWSDGELVVGSRAKKFPRRWLFLPSAPVLAVLQPERVFRRGARDMAAAYLLPLAVLSKLDLTKSKAGFGEPLLEDFVHGTDPVPYGHRSDLETWLSSIPLKERAGFCVELGVGVWRLLLPSFKPSKGKRVWGVDAVNKAKRQVALAGSDHDEIAEARDAVASLSRQWDRTGPGYFDYFWALSILARLHWWRPSSRALARCLLSNLVSMRPKWGEDETCVVVPGLRYWAKSCPSLGDESEDTQFYPALGKAQTAWSLDAWLAGAGYVESRAESSTSARAQFAEDMETLGHDLRIKWRVFGNGRRVSDLEEVRQSARNERRWKQLRLEPLIPTSLIEEFHDPDALLLFDEDEPSAVNNRDSEWTAARLSSRLRKKGLTQKQLAALVGSTPSMISQIISGQKAISTAMASKLDQVFKPAKRTRVNRDQQKNAES